MQIKITVNYTKEVIQAHRWVIFGFLIVSRLRISGEKIIMEMIYVHNDDKIFDLNFGEKVLSAAFF